MTPLLRLGSYDAPSLELKPWDIYPIVALVVELYRPMNSEDLDSVRSFLQLDSLWLDKETERFFLKIESVCKRIVADELVRYSVRKTKASEFSDEFKRYANDGVVTPGVKIAAQSYLDFLVNNSDYWPLKAQENNGDMA